MSSSRLHALLAEGLHLNSENYSWAFIECERSQLIGIKSCIHLTTQLMAKHYFLLVQSTGATMAFFSCGALERDVRKLDNALTFQHQQYITV